MMADWLAEVISDGLALIPTDTLYALAGDARSVGAVNRVFELKHRPPEKKLSVMLAPEILGEWFWIRPEWEVFFPGPYTLLLTPKKKLALPYPKIGVRVPADEVCLGVLRRIGFPLTATSANLSGECPPRTLSEVPARILLGVDVVIFGRPKLGRPSTVFDPETGEVFRWGAGEEEVRRFLTRRQGRERGGRESQC